MGGTFIQAAMILLREGLEAMLVIAALAAYLDKAGARSRLPALYGGAVLAIGASLIAAFLFAMYNGGEHNDLIEGITMLVAAGLMLYVSGWLLVRQDQAAYQRMLKEQADVALAKSTGIAVALLAFLAVFREGAETVLFIHALAGSSGGYSLQLVAGLIGAALALGHTGREGYASGGMFSMFALAAVARIGVIALALNQDAGFRAALAWLPAAAWAPRSWPAPSPTATRCWSARTAR